MLPGKNKDVAKPCPHMRNFISSWLDNALTGLALKYTKWHVSHCPRCTTSLSVLRALNGRLRALVGKGAAPPLSTDSWAAIEEAWQKADSEAATGSK